MSQANCFVAVFFSLLLTSVRVTTEGDFKHIVGTDVSLEYSRLNQCLIVTKPNNDSNWHCTQEQKSDNVDCSLEHEDFCAKIIGQVKTVFQKESKTKIQEYESLYYEGHWFHNTLRDGMVLPTSCAIIIIPKPSLDRSCLLSPLPTGPESSDVKVVQITHGVDIQHVVSFINEVCNTDRDVSGKLTMKGYHKEYIFDNLYSVESKTSWLRHKYGSAELAQCERISIQSWDHFFMDYLQISKPVIITSVIDDWKAHTKWTKDFLRQRYGNQTVHIKMSPTKDYEGIESAHLWDNYNSFAIPEKVKQKLQFPDLVVPRPAPVNMIFSDFLDLIENVANGAVKNASAYLEYSSIKSYFPEMLDDLHEMPFVKGKLHLQHLNIWLSDGNTVGKLHFDPFDNFLCMIDGRKELILFEPHNNENLYEAHIPEAEFAVDMSTLKFSRHELKETTSMVMSPIDLDKPDMKRFPLFENAKPLNCTISEGEVLFMPAFWWHEVRSSPNKIRNRNMAVNYWYIPFLTKEFPCPECKLNINPRYNHFL